MTSKKAILSLLLFTVSTFIGAQISPGGVGTIKLTSWFRADNLAAGNVTTWRPQFPTKAGAISESDAQAPYPQLELTAAGAVSNCNRTIDFSGKTYSGLNQSILHGLLNTNPPALLTNAYSGNQGSYFCAYYLPVTSRDGHLTLNIDGMTALQARDLVANTRFALEMCF